MGESIIQKLLINWRVGRNNMNEKERELRKLAKKDKKVTILDLKICGVNETDNPNDICDDCKFSIISNDDIPPNF